MGTINKNNHRGTFAASVGIRGLGRTKINSPLVILLAIEKEKRLLAAGAKRMQELDFMIANGWGNVPQRDMPEDWMRRKNGLSTNE